MIDPRLLYALVKKEFLDGVRNKWIIGVTLIFLVFSLVMSYFGAASRGDVGFQGFRGTALLMGGTSSFLVPILALMVGYASVAGEREQGSLGLLLSTPLTRLELLLGKFLGLTAILGVAILAGFGIAGVVVAATAGTAWWDAYLSSLGATLLLGAAFVAVALLFSSLLQKRSTALGAAVFVWFFFAIIYSVILFGAYVASGGALPTDPTQPFVLPDWYWALQLANPTQAFGIYVDGAFSSSGEHPGFVTPVTAAAVLLAWVAVPLTVTYLRFRTRDV